jgi:hypothetical protein
MGEQYHAVYQSGQQVLLSGWYEAVGATVPTVSPLEVGMSFPNYDGRAICWHQLDSEPRKTSQRTVETQSAANSEIDLVYCGMYA